MDRRAFLGTLALLAAPRAAEAQQAGRVYRIGMLSDGPPQTQEQRAQSPFVKELKALGWVEGGNVTFEDRRSTSVEQLDSLATDLVTLKVDVIYTGGTPAIRAAKRATRSIPIPIVMWWETIRSPMAWSPASHGRAGTLLGSRLSAPSL